ncbi:MAG: alpha/beta hydrolase [Actinomycetota bacterium]
MNQFLAADVERLPLSGGTTVHRRIGAGAPVLLLHGYPETHVCWHRVAPALAEQATVIAPDLPGYGDSAWSHPDDEVFSKRSMAVAMVELMASVGYAHFAVVGHDRGARVAYRLALDHPGTVTGLAVIDIAPTSVEWELIRGIDSVGAFHWPFLAQPDGLPEALLAEAPDRWIDHLLDSWSADPDAIVDEVRTEYRRCFRRAAVRAATCGDYRAGAGVDRRLDLADRADGRTIDCPVLAVASADRGDLAAHWRPWAPTLTAVVVDGGHFLPEENAPGLLAHLAPFLADRPQR